MLNKSKMLNKLKDTASKIKDTGIEEAKKLTEEHIPDETIKKIQNKAQEVINKKTTSDSATEKHIKSDNKELIAQTEEEATSAEESITSDQLIDETSDIGKYDRGLLEDLLEARLPDWAALKSKANEVVAKTQPECCVPWIEDPLPIGKKHLRKGIKHDLWQSEKFLVLQAHPSIFEKIIASIASFLSIFLYPWYAFKNALQKAVEKAAEKLGVIFSIFALPVALLAFLGDIITMALEFLVSIPRLVLSPLTLIKSFFSLILQFFARLLARIIWAFLLPVIGKILSGLKPGKVETLQKLLKRKPWVRYIILGFFRSERPTGPLIIIPTATVSQILLAKRGGVFNRGEYLILVEGEELDSGLMNRIKSWFKITILPFYWERTAHILCLPKDANARKDVLDIVSSVFEQQVKNWE